MSPAVRSTAVFAAVLAIQVAVAGCDDEPRMRGDGDRAATGTEGSWHRIRGPARRLHGAQNLLPVAVGDKVVVIAGVDYDQANVKALVVDPGARRASRTAPSRLWWRFGYTAVAAGDEVIVWGGCCGPAGRGSRAPGAVYDIARDEWTRLGPGPLGSRRFHTAVWTGEEMIVWGGWAGTRLRAGGAAYDPRTGTWRRLAPAPLSPRQYHVAVWTGEEMIVWGGSKPVPPRRDEQERLLFDGAAYDPDRDTWRRLAPTRLLAGSGSILDAGLQPNLDAEWTGEQMTIWSRAGAGGYDPDRDRWKRIPAPRRHIRRVAGGQTVWSADELIVWGGTGGDGSDIQQGAAYDPSARRWRSLPDAPIRGRDRHAAVAIPRGMLVWGGCCRKGSYYTNGAIYLRDRSQGR